MTIAADRYVTMTDHELAVAHEASVVDPDGEDVYIENEIAGRLQLPADDTEQGFTLGALVEIDVFIALHLHEEPSSMVAAMLRRR